MMAIPDALILLVVYFVAGAYTLLVYPWIAGRHSNVMTGLIAGSGVMKTIVVLTTAILGVPLLIWGLGSVGTRIPDGDCFRYRRRYAIYVGGPFDPDSVIAATGCPVINGRRWRGYLGDNQPDVIKRQVAIPVESGAPFRVVEMQ